MCIYIYITAHLPMEASSQLANTGCPAWKWGPCPHQLAISSYG